jgi:hypothetical protein
MNFSFLFGVSLANESNRAKKNIRSFRPEYRKVLDSRNDIGSSGTAGYSVDIALAFVKFGYGLGMSPEMAKYP